MSSCAVPLVDVATWSLCSRDGPSLVFAVASSRNKTIKNVISTGWKWDTDIARRTVGDFDAAFAHIGTAGTALTVWSPMIWTYRTPDHVTYQSITGAVQRSRATLADFARRFLDLTGADTVCAAVVRTREGRRRYNNIRI